MGEGRDEGLGEGRDEEEAEVKGKGAEGATERDAWDDDLVAPERVGVDGDPAACPPPPAQPAAPAPPVPAPPPPDDASGAAAGSVFLRLFVSGRGSSKSEEGTSLVLRVPRVLGCESRAARAAPAPS